MGLPHWTRTLPHLRQISRQSLAVPTDPFGMESRPSLSVVSVALDTIQRIEANLLMRNYGGFLSGGGAGAGKGKRIKGRQY